MKTLSILQYDHEEHQFYPSFVIHNDPEDLENECAYDEMVIQPSEAWMEEYLQWNRFGRLLDDPAEDMSEEDDPTTSIPTFASLQELHQFNAQGQDLTQRLKVELEQQNSRQQSPYCSVQVVPFKPLYSNMVVGPIAAWWHVKDRNYGFVVPVQRLPVSDQLKSRLQAFRCHKGMEFWQLNDADTMSRLQQEGRELQKDLLGEVQSCTSRSEEKNTEGCNVEDATSSVEHVESMASLGTLLKQSCSFGAAPAVAESTGDSRLQRIPHRPQ